MKLRASVIRRAVAITLIFALCVPLYACSSSGDDEDLDQLRENLYGTVELLPEEEDTSVDATTSNFTLAYSRKDTLNPYKCTSTLNATVGKLMYDQLVAVNSEYEAEMVVAKEITATSPRIISVVLRSGIVFSDGSVLTGEDVKYSFEAAKAAGSKYASQLVTVTNCTATENTVTFRITNPDPLVSLLLDFPIIKAGSDANDAVPIGSGRFYYVSDMEKGVFLLRNEKWYSTSKPSIERISLVSMPTVESIVHSIEIGTVSYFYTDLRDGYPTRINSNYTTVDLNNIVYLGMNTYDSRLAVLEVRRAMSQALNREEITTNAFSGRAYSATGPFTTSWPEAAAAQYGSTLSNSAGAVTSLTTAGFVNLDPNYIRYNVDGRALNFSLLVSAGNQQHVAAAQAIAHQLKAVGINITVYPIGFENLRQRIAAGNYELYLAEYSLLNNMDISPLFMPGTGLYTGPQPAGCVTFFNGYRDGTATLSELVEAFESDLPYIPVCFRLGMVCYTRSLSATMDVSESDPFHGIQLWEPALATNETGGSATG